MCMFRGLFFIFLNLAFLPQILDNWKYHKSKVASYWLVKLDSTKQRKVSLMLESDRAYLSQFTPDLPLHRIGGQFGSRSSVATDVWRNIRLKCPHPELLQDTFRATRLFQTHLIFARIWIKSHFVLSGLDHKPDRQ